jgi:serine/threonine-protein kinase
VPVVEVPDVVGLTLEDAQKKLADVNLSSQVLRKEHHLEVAENRVISQDREPGSEVRDTVVIGLVVSLGPAKANMPDVTGKPVDEAISLLKELGLKDEQINREAVESEKEPGTVLQQSPAAEDEIIPERARVTLVVSEGPGTVEMPDLIGRKESEAISILTSSGLKYKIRREPDYKMEKDRVFGQHPYEAGDQVKPGSEVTLLVSDGLPEDALQPVKMIRLEPETEGTVSVFQISINDAVGTRDWGNAIETDKPITVPVQVTVAPDKSANITVYRDSKWYNMWSVTYRDAMMLELGENDEDAGGGTDGGEPHTRSHEPASDGGAGAENGGFAEEAQGSQPLSQSDGGTD